MMEEFSNQIAYLSKKSHSYTSGNTTLEAWWKRALKCIFDHMREEEEALNISHGRSSFIKLHTKSMDIEQIWQQLDLQNEQLLSMSEMHDSESLWSKVANLCMQIEKELPEDTTKESSDEGVESGEDKDTAEGADDEGEGFEEEEEEPREDEDEPPNEDSNLDENDEIDAILDSNHEESDLEVKGDLDNLNDSDFDADTFGDIALEEAESDEDFEMEYEGGSVEVPQMNQNGDKRGKFQHSDKKFAKTEVDTHFLNLRESEWIADNDLIGVQDGDLECIDYMQDIDSGVSDEDSGRNAMYSDFFDPNDEELPGKFKSKSSFKQQVEKENELIESLEQENISDKPWFLKGEVLKDQRPENSTLEEELSCNVAVRPKPTISDDIMNQIEKIILSRINTHAWDDVERKIKSSIDPSQYKKSLILDQEKSKKSLAEIYEQEYLKLQEKGTAITDQSGPSTILGQKAASEEQLPEHKQIKDAMDSLFMKLNALSNYHYTPRATNAELKIVSNLPAVTVEEVTPSTATDAVLLAPEEVVVPLRGDPKGSSEKTRTDKQRDRRSKKAHQRHREQKLKERVKRRSRDGSLASVGASAKLLEKAINKGQVKLLDSEQHAVKSSSAFFQQLQESANLSRKRKSDIKESSSSKKKKMNSKGLSASKVLL